MRKRLATPSDPAFQQAVEQVMEQYLRTHPEVIEQSLTNFAG